MAQSTQNILIAIMVVTVLILLLNLYMLRKFNSGRRSEEPSVTSALPAAPAHSGIDPAVVAAVTAAIATVLDQEAAQGNNATGSAPRAKFIVKSIKKA